MLPPPEGFCRRLVSHRDRSLKWRTVCLRVAGDQVGATRWHGFPTSHLGRRSAVRPAVSRALLNNFFGCGGGKGGSARKKPATIPPIVVGQGRHIARGTM